jgi:hypothetical protein
MLRARKLASAALTASLVTAGGIGTTVLSVGAAHAGTCPTASQIVTDINVIASAAGGLNARPGALTPSSSPGDVQSAAQSTAAGLNTMVNDLSADTTALGGCPAPLSSADSQTVTAAFRSLTSVTQHMFSTLTGKHAIFAQYSVTAPIASSLRALEAALDSYTYALISAAPSQQGAITNDKDSADSSLGNAITFYGQLCIPSPLYPTVMPVCVGL